MAKQRWQGTRYWLLLLSTIGLAIQVCGQPNSKLDSLIAQLDTTRRDTVELSRLCEVNNLLYDDPRGIPYLKRYGALVEELLRSGIPAVAKLAEQHQSEYLNMYALDQMQRENYVLALRTFERSLALNTARGDLDWIAMMHNNIGWLHENAGDEVRAIVAYKRALEVVRNHAEDVTSLSATSLMSHLGALFTDLGALDSAQFYLEQGLAGTDSVSFAHDHLCMGQLREAQGRYAEAIRHLTWARDRAEREQNHQLFFASLGTLRRVYTAMNKPELAAAVVEELVVRARAIGNDQQLSGALLRRGELLRKSGALDAAERDLRTALSLARTNGYLKTIVSAAGELRELYEGKAEYKDALAMMVEMTAAADSMRNMDARSEVMLREFRGELAADSLASAQEAGHFATEVVIVPERRGRADRQGVRGDRSALGDSAAEHGGQSVVRCHVHIHAVHFATRCDGERATRDVVVDHIGIGLGHRVELLHDDALQALSLRSCGTQEEGTTSQQLFEYLFHGWFCDDPYPHHDRFARSRCGGRVIA